MKRQPVALMVSCLAASTALLAGHAPVLRAGEWRAQSSAAVTTFISDNICLASSDKQTDSVTTARPNVSVRGRGGRLNLALNAGAELNTLDINEIDCEGAGGIGGVGQFRGNRESFVPRGTFNVDFEAIENWLILRADARAAQNPINPFAPGGEDNVNARNNTNTTYQYGVGATARRRLPNNLLFDASVDYDEQRNGVGLVGDSEQERASFSFGMDPAASRIALGVRGNYQQVTFDETTQQTAFRENELRSAEVFGTVQLTRSFQLNARAGEEDNRFLAAAGDVDGSFWDVGVRWTPNSRLTADLGYGERFFGDNARASVTWRHKRSTLSASYRQTVAFPRNLRLGGLVPDADLGEPLPGDPLESDGTPTFLARGPVQIDSFGLDYTFSARRTGFGLNARWTEQSRFDNAARLETLSLGATASRRLGPTLSANASVRWLDNQGGDDLGDNGFLGFRGNRLQGWQGSLGLNKTLGNRTSLALRYSYRDQEAGFFGDVIENRVQLSLRYEFL